MVNTKVAVSGQPAAFVVTLVYVPDAVYDVDRSQPKCTWITSRSTHAEDEVLLLIVNTKVAVYQDNLQRL